MTIGDLWSLMSLYADYREQLKQSSSARNTHPNDTQGGECTQGAMSMLITVDSARRVDRLGETLYTGSLEQLMVKRLR